MTLWTNHLTERTAARLAYILVPLLCLSGCLKTRAQLKDDGDDAPSKPVPTQVQEVQPQGQYVLEEIKSEITRLNGRVEDIEKAQTGPGGAPKQEEVKKLEARIVELEQAQVSMLEAIKKLQADTPLPDSKDLYEQGKTQFESGDLNDAISTLSNYLKNPSGKYAEDATFLRGQAYFDSKQFKKAIVDFSKFPEKFSKSKKMPSALFKIAQSFESLGMKQDSRDFYSELVEKFPKSSEAKKARSKLK